MRQDRKERRGEAVELLGFWTVAGAITLGVALMLILALRRNTDSTEEPADFDRRVYRDQLREIERDQARGIIAEDEAQRLRSEVARRLLDTDRIGAAQAAEPPLKSGPNPIFAVAIVAVALAAGFGVYSYLGQPAYPDLPIKTRIAMAEERRDSRPSQAEAEAALPAQTPLQAIDPEFLKLVEKLRETVIARPDDLQGHQLLARNEANLGNFGAAQRAQGRVIELKGADAEPRDLLLRATLMVQATGGMVSPEAERLFLTVLQQDPNEETGLFFMGILNMQVGRYDVAFRFWRKLLDVATPQSPWLPEVRGRIESLADAAGVRFELPPAAPALGGPSAADVEAAAGMSAEDRETMIRGMVEGLNDRLATEGGTAAEWARLIVALANLGEGDRARAILTEAQNTFAGRDADLETIAVAARQAGLTP